MDTEFLRTILPENDGWFYLVHMHQRDKTPEGENNVTHRAVKSSDLASGVHKCLSYFQHKKSPPTNGLFFTPWSYTVDYIPDGGGNARKHDTYKLTCQSLWLDVDIKGEGHASGYPDRETALRAVTEAIDPAVMPKPTYIVETGGGYQFFWVLGEALDVPAWLEAAGKFDTYFRQQGVQFDPISRDHSRFLRLPDTDNMKTGTARPCKVLGSGDLVSTAYIALWPEAEGLPIIGTQEKLAGLWGATDENMGSHDVYSKKFMAEISKNCNLVNLIASDGGAQCDEPLWKDLLNLAVLCEDSDEWATKLSEGHDSYTAEGLALKLRERVTSKAPRCSTLEAHALRLGWENPCEGCSLHKQGGTCSPLRAGNPDKPALVVAPLQNCQPEDIEITTRGTYKLKPAAKDDEPPKRILLCQSVIMEVEALQRSEGGSDESFLRVTHQTGHTIKSRVIALTCRASKPETIKALLAAGITASAGREAELGDAFMTWHNRLTTAGQASQYSLRQGWMQEKQEIVGFSHGPCVFRTDGTVSDSGVSDTGGEDIDFIPKGDLEPWKESVRIMLEGGGQAHSVILASAFAAPLVELMGIEGLPAVLSFWCTGGSGKSTALRAARSVWAKPDTNISSQASAVAAQTYLKEQPSLPLYWDEPRNDRFGTRDELREFLFMLTGGISKLRALQTGEGTRSRFRPRTMAAVASNESLAAEVSERTGEAEGKRFLEIRMDELKHKTGDRAFKPLNRNYAVAGPVYAEYLVNNLAALEVSLDDTKEQVWKMIGGKNEDRYYANAITALVVGASIATKLGLVVFDVTALLRYLTAVVAETRVAVATTMQQNTATEDVLRYIRDKDTFGWRIKKFAVQGHKEVEEVGNVAGFQPTWSYVLACDDGVARISRSDFKEWYQKKHAHPINWTGWEAKAVKEGIWGKNKQRSLSVNNHTFGGSARVYCLEVQIADLADNPLKVTTQRAISSPESASSQVF